MSTDVPRAEDEIQREVEANYAAFQEKLPELISSQHGKLALMRGGEIVELLDTARDAYLSGQRLYGDGLFSVQEVTDIPIDLGFYSHALPVG